MKQLRFEELSQEQQDQARARFFDAPPGDGHLYELDIGGNILCRCEDVMFAPAFRAGRHLSKEAIQ